MNILIIARADHSGAGYALMQAINACTEHKARHVSYKRTWLQYPYDILKPTDEQLWNLCKWADVINAHSDIMWMMPEPRPIIKTYHGSYYRNRWQEINRKDKADGWKQTCVPLTLAPYGPKWIGRAIPDLSSMHKPSSEFTVHHCATHPQRKGTQHIKQALTGIPLQVITKTPNAECLEMRAKCHVVVERYKDTIGTIGTTAIESMSMGLPVISWASPEGTKLITDTIGYVPFINAGSAIELREAVCRLRDDRDYYLERQEIGFRYVRDWHAPKVIAEKFIEYINE